MSGTCINLLIFWLNIVQSVKPTCAQNLDNIFDACSIANVLYYEVGVCSETTLIDPVNQVEIYYTNIRIDTAYCE